MSLEQFSSPLRRTAVFAGAFLLFALQPLAAKRLLPVYGGSSSVWTVCLLFFQVALLAGYAWAHLVRHKPWVHAAAAVLAAGSLYFFSVAAVPPSSSPALSVLLSLTRSVGLPYFVLSATSPLLQAWAKDYRLYAFSNLGSLLGLLGYVFVLDRIESIDKIYIGAYLLFAGLIVFCCAARHDEPDEPVTTSDHLTLPRVLLWILLALCGTGMLAATTNQICQEVASIPLLWVWPLGLYLLSFVICFESPRWYSRRWFGRLAAALIPAACIVTPMGTEAPYWAHLLVDSGALFMCLMLCHGELAERRPEENLLTSFYLAVAGGGVIGSLLVTFAAPSLFTSYLEFPLFLMIAGLTTVTLWWRERVIAFTALVPLTLGALVPLAYLSGPTGVIVAEMRNFYGVVRVSMGLDARGQKLVMTHGQTMHGTEYIPEKSRPSPSSYYSPQSGVGLAIGEHRRGSGMDVGVIGLGAGTLASYARPGDHWRFYEINPDVIHLASEPFTYLRTALAPVDIKEGDGRLSIEKDTAARYDILVVDAFSSDSIPVHLLTRECAKVYRARLKPDGILAIHISNRTLDLEPVVRGLAESIGFQALRINNSNDAPNGVSASSWMLLSGSRESLDGLRRASTAFETRPPIVWKDGHADVIGVLTFSN